MKVSLFLWVYRCCFGNFVLNELMQCFWETLLGYRIEIFIDTLLNTIAGPRRKKPEGGPVIHGGMVVLRPMLHGCFCIFPQSYSCFYPYKVVERLAEPHFIKEHELELRSSESSFSAVITVPQINLHRFCLTWSPALQSTKRAKRTELHFWREHRAAPSGRDVCLQLQSID